MCGKTTYSRSFGRTKNRSFCRKSGAAAANTPPACKKARTSFVFKIYGGAAKTVKKVAAIALLEAALTCKHPGAEYKMAASVDGMEEIVPTHSQITPCCMVKFTTSARGAYRKHVLHKACQVDGKGADIVAAGCYRVPTSLAFSELGTFQNST